jgi:hypothetical protein
MGEANCAADNARRGRYRTTRLVERYCASFTVAAPLDVVMEPERSGGRPPFGRQPSQAVTR